jgi:hypothetical protein
VVFEAAVGVAGEVVSAEAEKNVPAQSPFASTPSIICCASLCLSAMASRSLRRSN